jgi:hypothetical protein
VGTPFPGRKLNARKHRRRGATGPLFDLHPKATSRARPRCARDLVDALGDERFRALRDEGAAMDTDTAVAYALSHLNAFMDNTGD